MKTIVCLILMIIITITTSLGVTRALLIGIGSFYDKNIQELEGVYKDIERLERVMKILGVDVEVLKDLTLGRMKAKIRKFLKRINEEDLGIIYYGGHGYTSEGRYYLIPSDVDSEDIESSSLEIEWLFGELENAKGRMLVMIDACYSGVIKGMKPLGMVKIKKENFEEIAKEGKVSFILSSEGTERSKVELFAKCVEEGLKGEADKDNDGWVRARELYEYVHKEMEKETNGEQNPVMIGKDMKVVRTWEWFRNKIINVLYKSEELSEEEKAKIMNVMKYWEEGKLEGEIKELLGKLMEKYVSGKIDEEALLIAMKPYLEKVKEEGVGRVKKEEEGIKEVGEVERGMKEGKEGTCILKVYAENELARSGKVYLDGEYAGELKEGICVVEDIPKGRHEVVVTSDRMDDYITEVKFEGEYEVKEVHVEGRPAVRVVKVRSEPVDVEVYVDGEYKGRTPVYIKLEVGKEHEVVMKKEGYKEIRKRVMIPEKGKMVEWDVIKLRKMVRLTIFEDDFRELNTSIWIPYGNPLPRVIDHIYGRYGVFDNNGDGWYDSGIIMKDPLSLVPPFEIESDIYLDLQNESGCWNKAGYELVESNDYRDGDVRGKGRILRMEIRYTGDACWAEPEEYRRHAYIFFGFITEDGEWDMGTSANYNLQRDDLVDGWHRYRVVVDNEGYVSFYVDGELLYRSSKKIDLEKLLDCYLNVGFRSSGSAGKSYHDFIRIKRP